MTVTSCFAAGWVHPVSNEPVVKWRYPERARDASLTSYAQDATNPSGGGYGETVTYDFGRVVRTDRFRCSSDFGWNTVDRVTIRILTCDESGQNEAWALLHEGAIQDVQLTEIPIPNAPLFVKKFSWTYHYTKGGFIFWLFDAACYELDPVQLPPVARTAAPTSLELASAVLHGDCVSDGGLPCQYRFVYAPADPAAGPETATPWSAQTLTTGESAAAVVTGLLENTPYRYRLQLRGRPADPAAPPGPLGEGAAVSFTTAEPDPSAWLSPTGHSASGAQSWLDIPNVYDDRETTAARFYHEINGAAWTPYLLLDHAPIPDCVGFRLKVRNLENLIDEAEIQVLKDAQWQLVYAGAFDPNGWLVKSFPKGSVTQARLRLRVPNASVGFFVEVAEADFTRNPELVRDETPNIGNGTGLIGRYYDDLAPDSAPFLTRTDSQVWMNWEAGSPAPGIAPDTFRAVWTGQLLAQHAGAYTFTVRSDDGARLWVGGRRLIEGWANGAAERSGTISLLAGERYPIRLEYFENTGSAYAQLFWSGPGTPRQAIPSTQLFPVEGAPFEIASKDRSFTNPAWVEGPVSEDIFRVTVEVNSAPPRDCVRENPARWHASDTGDGKTAPEGILLNAQAPTSLRIVARDGEDHEMIVKTQELVWAPLDLSTLNASIDAVRARKGDRLLLTASSSGTGTLQIDANGDGNFEFSGGAGERYEALYPVAGNFLAQAKINGVLAGSLRVSVFAVGTASPVMAQQEYTRGLDVTVTPAELKNDVLSLPLNLAELDARVSEWRSTGSRLSLRPVLLGESQLAFRIGGRFGPIVRQVPVRSFQLKSLNAAIVPWQMGEAGYKEAVLRIQVTPRTVLDNDDPATPDKEGLYFDLNTHTAAVTFVENGRTTLRLPSTRQDASGVFEAAVRMDPGQSSSCHAVGAVQIASPIELVGGTNLNNPTPLTVCPVVWFMEESNDETSRGDQERQEDPASNSKRYHPPSPSAFADGQHQAVWFAQTRTFAFSGKGSGVFSARIQEPQLPVVPFDVMTRNEIQNCPSPVCRSIVDAGATAARAVSHQAEPKAVSYSEIVYPIEPEQDLNVPSDPPEWPLGTFDFSPLNWKAINPGDKPSRDYPEICGPCPCMQPVDLCKRGIPNGQCTEHPMFYVNNHGNYDLWVAPGTLCPDPSTSPRLKNAVKIFRLEAVGPRELDEASVAQLPEPDGTVFPDVTGVVEQAGPVRIAVDGGETQEYSEIHQPISPTHPVKLAATRKGIIEKSTTYFHFAVQQDPNWKLPGNGRLRYVWDFGDGSSEEGLEVSHVYGRPGRFNLLLLVLYEDPEQGWIVVAKAQLHGINILAKERDTEQGHPGYLPREERFGTPVRILVRGKHGETVNIGLLMRKRFDMGSAGRARVSLDGYPEDEHLNGFTEETSARKVEGLAAYFSMQIDGQEHGPVDGDGGGGSGSTAYPDENMASWVVFVQGMAVNDLADNIELIVNGREVRAKCASANAEAPTCEYVYTPTDWEAVNVAKLQMATALESMLPLEDDAYGIPDKYDMVFVGQIQPEMATGVREQIRAQTGVDLQEGVPVDLDLGPPAFAGDDSQVLLVAPSLGRPGIDGLRDQENPNYYQANLVFDRALSKETVETILVKSKTNFALNGLYIGETFVETAPDSRLFRSSTSTKFVRVVLPEAFDESKVDEAFAILQDGDLRVALVLEETGAATLTFQPFLNRSVPFQAGVELSGELRSETSDSLLLSRYGLDGELIEQRVLTEIGNDALIFTDGVVMVDLLFHAREDERREPMVIRVTGFDEAGGGTLLEALLEEQLNGRRWRSTGSPVHQGPGQVTKANRLSGPQLLPNRSRTGPDGMVFSKVRLRLADDPGLKRDMRFKVVENALPPGVELAGGPAESLTDGSLLDIRLDEHGDALAVLPVIRAGFGELDEEQAIAPLQAAARNAPRGFFRRLGGWVVHVYGTAKKAVRQTVEYVKEKTAKFALTVFLDFQKATEIGRLLAAHVSGRRLAATMLGYNFGVVSGILLGLKDGLTDLVDMGDLIFKGLAALWNQIVKVERQRLADLRSGDALRMVQAALPTGVLLTKELIEYVLSDRFKTALEEHVLKPMRMLKDFVVTYAQKAYAELGAQGLGALPGLFDLLWKDFDKTLGGKLAVEVMGYGKTEIEYGLYGFSYLGGLVAGYVAINVAVDVGSAILTGGAALGKTAVSLALKSQKLAKLGKILFSVPVKIASKAKAAKGLLAVGDIFGKMQDASRVDKIVDLFTASGESSKLSRLVQRHLDNFGGDTAKVNTALTNVANRIQDADVAADTMRTLARMTDETGRSIVFKNADELEGVGDGVAVLKRSEKQFTDPGNVEEKVIGISPSDGKKIPCD